MEITALLWLINDMTHSPLMGTLMVTLRFLPMIVFAFVGGIVADRMNRRTLLIYALTASAILSILLAILVHTRFLAIWHLLLYSVLTGVYTSFNHPARMTLLPNLVKKEHLMNAITLDNASVMVSRIVGAPLAGVIIGAFGTTPVLGLRAVGAIIAIIWLSRIQASSTKTEPNKASPFNNFIEGIHYVGENKAVLTQVLLYLLPFFVMNSYTGLLPYYATDVLAIGPDLFGVLNAAPGIGAVIAVLVLASFVNVQRKSLLLVLAGIFQGIVLLIFAISTNYMLSLILLIIIGAVGTIFMTLNNTIIQEMVPDRVRGRVMSLREVAMGLGPSGSLVSGFIAGITTVSLALGITGGISIAVLAGILVVFRNWQEKNNR